MDIQQVAAAAGVAPDTIRYYLKTATRARLRGTEGPRDLPAPQRGSDGKNYWDDLEIYLWIQAREKPAKRGAIPKATMQAVLDAALADDLETVITLARGSLS